MLLEIICAATEKSERSAYAGGFSIILFSMGHGWNIGVK
jgi:hypothetical protein